MGGFTSPKKFFLAILLLSAVIIVGVFFLYGYFIEDEGRSSLGVLSEEEALIIRSEMKDCYDQGGREGCYKQVANSLLEKFQPREILISFEENEIFRIITRIVKFFQGGVDFHKLEMDSIPKVLKLNSEAKKIAEEEKRANKNV